MSTLNKVTSQANGNFYDIYDFNDIYDIYDFYEIGISLLDPRLTFIIVSLLASSKPF